VTTTARVDAILGQGGLLSKHLARYEHRPQQLAMARAVSDALADRATLLVEAATGTGKTLAYLVPALLSGKRVVISTGTKALQEQLFQKDIPFLAQHWHRPIQAVLLKGRRNYACKLRVQEQIFAPKFRTAADASYWPTILDWYKKTETGDRAEIRGLPDDYATWQDLSIGGDACLGAKCKHYESCFVTRARKKAQEADLIVVNHHLFFADLSLKQDSYAEILPEFDVVVFDEAHHLEDVAGAYFGTQISNLRISELIGDLRRLFQTEGIQDSEADQSIKAVATHGTSLFTLLAFTLSEGRYPLQEVLRGHQAAPIAVARRELAQALSALERDLKRLGGVYEAARRAAERAAELKYDMEAVLGAEDPRYTYFFDIRDRGVFVQAAPIDLAKLFRERLLARHDTIIFTSATLATGGDFRYFAQRIGLSRTHDADEAAQSDDKPKRVLRELILPPVFNYEDQALLYIPKNLPEPNEPGYQEGVLQILEYLVGISGGSAFLLFTSWGQMDFAYKALGPKLTTSLGITVMKQGDKPKSELLEEFKRDVSSVLFATSSFWEGVDVEGDALRLVVLDKLPFSVPDDPLIKARVDLLKSRGGNPFMELSVPQAALTLKQGFGRLIRSQRDAGVVAILDSRIAKRRYGSYFLKSLPPAPVVWSAPEVKRWWLDKFGPKGA
jgi:ATP-dependent DNA helicase DinG